MYCINLMTKLLSCFKAYDIRGRIPDVMHYNINRNTGLHRFNLSGIKNKAGDHTWIVRYHNVYLKKRI